MDLLRLMDDRMDGWTANQRHVCVRSYLGVQMFMYCSSTCISVHVRTPSRISYLG